MNPDQRLSTAAEAAVQDRLPALMYERSRMRSAGIEPTGVLMPAHLNDPYDGPSATDAPATCMGLPVTWSDGKWGLIVTLPESRT